MFAREGVDVRVGARVAAVGKTGPGVRLDLAGGHVVEAQYLLVAVGRSPITEGMGLDLVGVRVDERGYVITDDHLATTAPGVYAAGDVTGRLLLTHAAFAQGRIAAANALGRGWRRTRYRAHATPWVAFTDPEVARVGLTEADTAGRAGG